MATSPAKADLVRVRERLRGEGRVSEAELMAEKGENMTKKKGEGGESDRGGYWVEDRKKRGGRSLSERNLQPRIRKEE